MNKREEKLLQNLKNLKFKLERRRERFVFLQQEIDRKAEEGSANATDYSKSSMYWHKQRRLEDRIYFIDDKLFSLEKSKLTYGIKDLINNVLIGESK